MSPTWKPPNPNFKDLTGQRFGKLVVVRLIPPGERPKRKYHYTLWECKCDCGNTCNARASDLQQGRINSCKCLRNILANMTPEERLEHKRARQLAWQRKNKDKISEYYRKKNPPGQKRPLRFTEEELAIRKQLQQSSVKGWNEKWAPYKRCQRHGISFRKYQEMLEAQGGMCGICRGPQRPGKAFCIDHDHACCVGKRGCGKCVRGLLCDSCNWMLGSAYDSVDRLQAAIDYLKKWKKPDELNTDGKQVVYGVFDSDGYGNSEILAVFSTEEFALLRAEQLTKEATEDWPEDDKRTIDVRPMEVIALPPPPKPAECEKCNTVLPKNAERCGFCGAWQQVSAQIAVTEESKPLPEPA